ncbi:MAG TPA: histidine phosphatase family protein [Tepidiformaceae bacterium]|nr:histidine phosphatase family protein [Tepidiformaceae bacterium]
MIVHLVRHGETPHNAGSITLGREDVPLNELGRRQAAALGVRLAPEPLSVIYASPLTRARETARAIAGERDIAVEIRDELIEMDVGETENIPYEEVRRRFPEFLEAWRGPHPEDVVMPGGESLRDVAARVDAFLGGLRTVPAEQVVVVTHNFVLKVLLCRLLEVELSAFRSFTTDVASLSTVVLRDGRIAIRVLNDRCHLHELES